jgi:hypothetical protein
MARREDLEFNMGSKQWQGTAILEFPRGFSLAYLTIDQTQNPLNGSPVSYPQTTKSLMHNLHNIIGG